MTIYTEKGFTSKRLEQIKDVDPFEWLANYPAEVIQRMQKVTPAEVEQVKNKLHGEYTDEDYVYLTQLEKKAKPKQLYFTSGYIEPNENGTVKRSNNSLIRRDLILIDYDDLTLSYDAFIQHVGCSLKDYNFIIYPTIKHIPKHTRARLVIQPDRPLLEYEYMRVLDELVEKLALPYDRASFTWSQCQGLPVITPRNQEDALHVNRGVKYPVPLNIEPPKATQFTPHTDTTTLPHEAAIQMMRQYVEVDKENLHDYTHAVSALCVLAKAVQSNEIDYTTANECAVILAMGNPEWEHNNQLKLNAEIVNKHLRTTYTFKRKFHDILFKPETMKSLYKRLGELGEAWRIENEIVNEKTGEVKQPRVPPRSVANILKKECTFWLIGEDDPELSPLAVYDLDSGTYNKGERFIYKLCLAVEATLKKEACNTVIHFLTTETEEVDVTKDKNLIVFNNGIYNRQTKQLLPFSKDYIFINKVSTNYVLNAPEPVYPDWQFSQWLKDLSDGDENKYKLLWQVIASAIDANNISELAIFLFSEKGSTGKSTFQALLTNLVGRRNTASLKIKEFEHDFKLASAYGKSLIIGDDNNPKDYNETSANFKSVITGDNVLLNPKGDKPFLHYFSALVAQSMNGIPRFNDVTDGLLRRLRVIKFNHVYKGKDKNRRIKEQYIKDPKLLEYIAFQALQVDCEEFENTEESTQIIQELELDNDKVLQFFIEVVENLHSQRVGGKFMFSFFNCWCRTELNITPKMRRNKFTKEAQRHCERFGWRYEVKNMTPGEQFKHADVELYDSMRSWQDPLFEVEQERWKRQGGFIKI
ncbi:phage/plasmid primase, P4 family [Aerococcaceae bacterium NML191292]|nr:phage/plasmid primase, P4 family [Aerococcaceae bacterium NML191292]